ncbi:MAG TPA: methionyl-tRNA formyltransferase [Arenimonas sp.]|nr:methionyl-tRNA formyltransferase [Arenimonas sp.]
MRIVFAGTPEFALPCLRAAAGCGDIVAVYTQPDRPAGRGRQLTPSPIKTEALARGWRIEQPENFKSIDSKKVLRELNADIMIVVAYGLLLPQSVLDIPKHGCWNVHASLLPRWRGAAPIQRAIEAGDSQTGVCLMQMEKGLDTGPVLLSLSTPISGEDTGGTLHDRLSLLGAEVLSDGLKLLRAGMKPVAQIQSEAGVCYAHKLDKQEARLDWSTASEALARKIRAFNPWPICEAQLNGERLRIHHAVSIPLAHKQEPGTILMANPHGLDIACGEGALRLLQVQREGGRMISIADYLNAHPTLRAMQ